MELIDENESWVMLEELDSKTLIGLEILIDASGIVLSRGFIERFHEYMIDKRTHYIGWSKVFQHLCVQEVKYPEDIIVTYKQLVYYLTEKIKKRCNTLEYKGA